MERLEIDLREEDRQKIASFLTKLLASTYALYLKTQNYHWNVKGMDFFSLHVMFEKQYEEFAKPSMKWQSEFERSGILLKVL